MTRRAKPVLHGRDHLEDGADPIPGLTIDDGGEPAGFALTYGAGTQASYVSVSTASSSYIDFYSGDLHSSGVTAATTGFTIVTAGVYQITASAEGSLTGPAGGNAADPDTASLGLLIYLNGSLTGLAQHQTQVDIPSGVNWVVPLAVVLQRQLDVGDEIRCRVSNGTDVSAVFQYCNAVVMQLA